MNKYQGAINYLWKSYDKNRIYGIASRGYLEILQELVEKADSFEWIPVSERLPKEHDSIFAKLYGTDKWNNKLWRTVSDRVLVTIKYDDGTRIVKESHTRDGEWSDEKRCMNCKVEAWMPLPKAYKEKDNETR
jgi:hypothetical protein